MTGSPGPVSTAADTPGALDLAAGTLRPRRRGIRVAERLGRTVIFKKARDKVMAKTAGHYPAPLSALEVALAEAGAEVAPKVKF